MKFIYCKLDLGVIDQQLMLVDTDAPSLSKVGTSRIENLGEELVYYCYQLDNYKVKLDGNPAFYKAVMSDTVKYSKDKQIEFLD